MGDKEGIYPELSLCGGKNECARTDTVFFPISEVSEGTVSLETLKVVELQSLINQENDTLSELTHPVETKRIV